jgi:ribosomal peptide maturation radical SAM protein 1
MNDTSVVLVAMPWLSANTPSIQLGILKATMDRHGVSTECRSFHLSFLDYLAEIGFPLSRGDYVAIADEHFMCGLGDWIFGVPPLRRRDERRDLDYAAFLRRKAIPDAIVQKAFQLREVVPVFLRRCRDDILRTRPRIVGFSTMFNQSIGSLALAKLLKEGDDRLKIVFGGANCEDQMGATLFRAYPFVDAVVRGEGELVFPKLVDEWLAAEPGDILKSPGSAAGLCFRHNGQERVVDSGVQSRVPVDDVPIPDYDEYFERLQTHRLCNLIEPTVSVPFEAARGCWWGAKSHCTFCGLNGQSMAFRSKSGERVFDEITALSRRYRRLDFFAVDNILDLRYLETLLPRIRDAGLDASFFFEVKANLTKAQLRIMRDAGLTCVQPGIESFSSSILKLMRKGTTGLQNVRLLKWCACFGIDPVWNLLYGFPGEDPLEYDRQAELIPALVHLKPPSRFGRVMIDRFSPYQTMPAEFGIEITGPAEYYRYIHDLPEDALMGIAHSFEARFRDGRDPEEYAGRCREAVKRWGEAWPASRGTLSYRLGPRFVSISDRRPGLPASDIVLSSPEADVFLETEEGTTPAAICRRLAQRDDPCPVDEASVNRILDRLADARLLYEERGQFLALPIRQAMQRERVEWMPRFPESPDVMQDLYPVSAT